MDEEKEEHDEIPKFFTTKTTIHFNYDFNLNCDLKISSILIFS